VEYGCELGVNKLGSTTKLETSNENESAATTTNDLAIRAGSNLRVIAIKTDTYDSLRELAGQGNNHKTYDSIIRKCVEAYKNK
jgi:hypothetical protein